MITPCCGDSISKGEWEESALNEPDAFGEQPDVPSCSVCGTPIDDDEVARIEKKTGKKAVRV